MRSSLHPLAWLLLWQVVLLVPAFLARPSPQYDRTIGALPPTCILLALGICIACRWLGQRLPAVEGWLWVPAAGLLAALGITTARSYFVAYAASAGPQRVFEYGQVFDAAVLAQRRPDPAQTVVMLGYASSTAVRYLQPAYAASTAMEDFSRLLPLPGSGPATYVFASPSLPDSAAQPDLMDRYVPGIEPVASANFAGGDPAARMYALSAENLHALAGANRPVNARIGNALLLVSASVPGSVTAQPGQSIRLVLTWQVLQPSRETYDAFIHVVDGKGKVVQQDDLQGLPAGGWRPGLHFASAHIIRLPADASAGQYRVLAGIDRRTNQQPSQSLGEAGGQVPVLTLEVGSGIAK